MPESLRRGLLSVLLGVAILGPAVSPAREVDRIIAVVEDEVVLESDLMRRVEAVRQGMMQSGASVPSETALIKQVLDRLITEKVELSMAERGGLKIDDETLRQAVLQIAQKNNMTPEELRESLRHEGIEYHDFLEQIRGEITQQRLRSSQVHSQIKISDHEVEAWLNQRGHLVGHPDTEFLLGHILVATPQTASAQVLEAARAKAERIVEDLRKGQDFKQLAATFSNSSEALKGGDLGWRKLSAIPTLFTELVPKLHKGDVEGPIRSPSGFHVIKLLDTRGSATERVTKTRVRHILIKPNDLVTNEDAKKKLEAIRGRVLAGDDFGDLARGNSDDKGSAVKGGELGFVSPGALVPEFEQAMNALEINQLSEPVQSQFGWHLIQVLERKESEDNEEMLKKKAQDDIFSRRVGEETELWLKKIRDEAYIEIRVPEYTPEGYSPPPAPKPKPVEKADEPPRTLGQEGNQETNGWLDGWF